MVEYTSDLATVVRAVEVAVAFIKESDDVG